MQNRSWRQRLTISALLGTALLVAACGPSAKQDNCENVSEGAKYTIKVTNNSQDKTYKVRLLVSKSKLDLSRDGENMSLEPGESKNFTVTIKKDQKRYVGVLWPAPKGDDTFKYKKQLDGAC